jgi:nucleoside-diphosphate-sugar epimerase
MTPVPLLILGGNGRIGQALRTQTALLETSGLRPVWQSRHPKAGYLEWDILAGPCPAGVASGVVLCLAGVIRGSTQDLALNETLALAACKAAADQGARHVFLASSAAVYGRSDKPLTEQTAPEPFSDYGRAKHNMERAALAWCKHHRLGLTILRIGNIAGLDALLGGLISARQSLLDPVAGQSGGPLRSYIGPHSLGTVLVQLAHLAAVSQPLPPILNIAASPPVHMADLLDAAGADWRYGPPNPAVVPRVELAIDLLAGLVPLPASASLAENMVAEWKDMAK